MAAPKYEFVEPGTIPELIEGDVFSLTTNSDSLKRWIKALEEGGVPTEVFYTVRGFKGSRIHLTWDNGADGTNWEPSDQYFYFFTNRPNHPDWNPEIKAQQEAAAQAEQDKRVQMVLMLIQEMS